MRTGRLVVFKGFDVVYCGTISSGTAFQHGFNDVIEIEPNLTVAELLHLILVQLKMTNVPSVTFFFDGHILNDEDFTQTCESIDLKQESVIHVRFYSGEGGMKKRTFSDSRG